VLFGANKHNHACTHKTDLSDKRYAGKLLDLQSTNELKCTGAGATDLTTYRLDPFYQTTQPTISHALAQSSLQGPTQALGHP
jgi:hypothetical protein